MAIGKEKEEKRELSSSSQCLSFFRFEWKKPGYEYNHKDAPILLVLGSERWRELLPEHPQSAPKGSQAEEKMNELLVWSHKEAQKFAEETKPFHLYV
jgi:hypothetical protein